MVSGWRGPAATFINASGLEVHLPIRASHLSAVFLLICNPRQSSAIFAEGSRAGRTSSRRDDIKVDSFQGIARSGWLQCNDRKRCYLCVPASVTYVSQAGRPLDLIPALLQGSTDYRWWLRLVLKNVSRKTQMLRHTGAWRAFVPPLAALSQGYDRYNEKISASLRKAFPSKLKMIWLLVFTVTIALQTSGPSIRILGDTITRQSVTFKDC